MTIQPAGGGDGNPLVLADLAAKLDVHDAAYELRSADGAVQPVTVAAGITLGALLREAGVDLDDFTYLEIPRADGTSVLVLRDQVLAEDAAVQPVVWEDADGLHFLRPPSGEDDVNAEDLVTPVDGALVVRPLTGDPLGVRIDVSRARVRPREVVAFAAVLVAGARPGVEFEWYFDDGAAGTSGANVTHRFTRPGTYNVLVNVSEGGRQLDVYDVATVVVAAPRRERGHPRRGSGGGGGGTAGGDGSGDGSGTGAGGNGSGAGSGTGAGAGGDGSGDGSGAGASGNGAGSGSPAGAPPPPRHREPARRRPARRAPTPKPPAATTADTVTGTLLASTDASPLAALASHRTTGARAEPKRPLQIPMGVWVAAGVALLVVAGWVVESRTTLPFWQD